MLPRHLGVRGLRLVGGEVVQHLTAVHVTVSADVHLVEVAPHLLCPAHAGAVPEIQTFKSQNSF